MTLINALNFVIMMVRINTDSNFLFRIVFSDETTFQLNGILNRHN